MFDVEGNYLDAWGSDAVVEPHGMYIDADDVAYMTDLEDHVAMKYSLRGRPVMALGNRGLPSDTGCEELGGKVLRPGEPSTLQREWWTLPRETCTFPTVTATAACTDSPPMASIFSSWGEPGTRRLVNFTCLMPCG